VLVSVSKVAGLGYKPVALRLRILQQYGVVKFLCFSMFWHYPQIFKSRVSVSDFLMKSQSRFLSLGLDYITINF